ncbi:MAG: hypothetical protein K2X49_22670 [Acetobacteraceae bacterium]|nr:hypothetical protein [Acetobacteraceae bacterium]
MSDARALSEAIYFDVYDHVAERAEYLQPDDHVRLLLPEAIIAFAVASILKPLVEGFAKKLGEKGAEAAVAALKPAPDPAPPTPEALIDEIAAALPAMIAEADRLAGKRDRIVAALVGQGLTPARAALIADAVITLVRQRLATHG